MGVLKKIFIVLGVVVLAASLVQAVQILLFLALAVVFIATMAS